MMISSGLELTTTSSSLRILVGIQEALSLIFASAPCCFTELGANIMPFWGNRTELSMLSTSQPIKLTLDLKLVTPKRYSI
jgi:hypothetical protein